MRHPLETTLASASREAGHEAARLDESQHRLSIGLAVSGVELDQTASLLLTLRFETHSKPPQGERRGRGKGEQKRD